METRKKKSPFGFLEGEDDETITQVHSLINNLEQKLESVDSAISAFLSDENKHNYHIFKNNLKMGVPWEIAGYSAEKQNNIFIWMCNGVEIPDYPEKTLRHIKIKQYGKEKTLEEILRLSQEKLREFEISRGYREVNASHVTGIEVVKVISSEVFSPDEPVPPSEAHIPGDVGGSIASGDSSIDKLEDYQDAPESPETIPEHEREEEAEYGKEELDISSTLRETDSLLTVDPPPTVDTPNHIYNEDEYNYTVQYGYSDYLKNGGNTPELDGTGPVNTVEQGHEAIEWDEHKKKCAPDGIEEYSTPNSSLKAPLQPNCQPPPSRPPRVPAHHAQPPSGNVEPLNVMLIGETGVGKTTFINASQNYLIYDSLEEALTGGPLVPVPTSFDMVVEQGSKPIGITVDESSTAASANEQLGSKKGESRTQKAMIHGFRYAQGGKTRTVRFVDTPGVLDTRGGGQDKDNYYTTMEIIQELPHIHAICILLKPNESRLTSEFIYTLDFLLMYLPRAALQHIVFCFTCSESFNFLPAETLPVLQEYLQGFAKRTNMSIPTDKNIFGFDNKCFRFQCTVKKYPAYVSKIGDYRKSWDNNRDQLHRMLEYVQHLKPFPTVDTTNISRVEKQLQKHVQAFIKITKRHVKANLELKTRWDNERSRSKGDLISAEVKERGDCFNSILKCVCHLTEFLYRQSVGVEDLFGKQLQKLIKDEEEEGHHNLTQELRVVADDYENKTKSLILKTVKKEIPMTTADTIQTMLHNLKGVKYYGSKVASSSNFSRNF